MTDDYTDATDRLLAAAALARAAIIATQLSAESEFAHLAIGIAGLQLHIDGIRDDNLPQLIRVDHHGDVWAHADELPGRPRGGWVPITKRLELWEQARAGEDDDQSAGDPTDPRDD